MRRRRARAILATQLLALARAEAGGATREGGPVFRPASDRRRGGSGMGAARDRAQYRSSASFSSNAVVSGNPLLMTELLNNLIDNALRYTSSRRLGHCSLRCGGGNRRS